MDSVTEPESRIAAGRERKLAKQLEASLSERASTSGLHIKSSFNLYYSLTFNDEGKMTGQDNAQEPIKRGGLAAFQVDLVAYETKDDGVSIPRVAIELKAGGLSTHQLILYSAKAEQHKQTYPYLRYGMVVAGWQDRLTPKVVRHGKHFDFIAVFQNQPLADVEVEKLWQIVKEEAEISRELGDFLYHASGKLGQRRIFRRRLTFDT